MGTEEEYNANKAVYDSMKPVHGDDVFYLFEWDNLGIIDSLKILDQF